MRVSAGFRAILSGTILAGALSFGFLADPAAAQERSIKVWFGRQDFVPEDEFAAFREDYPDINVEFEVIRLEDVNSQLILALRSGNAPDIVQIHTRDVEQLARGGVVKDVTHLIEEFEERFPETYEQLAPLAWEGAADSEGRLYGLALYAQSIYLTYRTDWLDEAGIEYPLETTDRVLEAARAIAEQHGEGYGFSLLGCCNSPTWELPLFLSMGGEIIDGVPQLDSEVGIEWISFYQTLMREGLAHSDTPSWDSGQMRAAFIGGRAGMMNEGEHIYVEVHKQIPYEEGRWAFEALPTRPGQTEPQVQSGFAFPFIVTTANEDEETALLALEYLARPEIAMQVAIRYQPTTNGAGFIPYAGTFLAFTDYARPAIRLAALMEQRVIHVMTHDSIGLGQDGPTHQPIEHLASLRAMPGARVFRPADAIEVGECWALALRYETGPSILALSRQAAPVLRREHTGENLCARGAYVLAETEAGHRATLLATGTEVAIAVAARGLLEAAGIGTRVVSMPCHEIFEHQDGAYRAAILGGTVVKVAVEAAAYLGWDRYHGDGGAFVGMTRFGASAPAEVLYETFGLTAEAVVAAVRQRL